MRGDVRGKAFSDDVRVLTIGHSTRTIQEFVGLLEAHGVERVVDVRTVPRSRHNPQFEQKAMAASLKKAGIDYEWMRGLGGLRHPRRDSVNNGWRNDSFRGYADYMQTPEFEHNLAELIVTARQKQTVIMCAEAVPWRCHRSLIADALSARRILAEHIMSVNRRTPHALTSFAKVRGTSVNYPADNTPDRAGKGVSLTALRTNPAEELCRGFSGKGSSQTQCALKTPKAKPARRVRSKKAD